MVLLVRSLIVCVALAGVSTLAIADSKKDSTQKKSEEEIEKDFWNDPEDTGGELWADSRNPSNRKEDGEGSMEFDELIFETKKKSEPKTNKPKQDGSDKKSGEPASRSIQDAKTKKKNVKEESTEKKNIQTPRSPVLQADTKKMEVETVVDVERSEADVVLNKKSFKLRPFGYIRMGLRFVQDDPGVAFIGRNDGFFLQNARFGVDASHKYVRLRLSADGARDVRDSPNALEGRLDFSLRDAFADVQVLNGLEVRVGHFRAQYDLESVLYPDQRLFLARSVASNGVQPTQGFEVEGLSIPRDIGAALRFKHGEKDTYDLEAELAFQNGTSSLASANDGQGIAVTGSLFAQFQGLFARAAIRYNPKVVGELPFRQNENDIGGMASLGYALKGFNVMGQVLVRRRTFETLSGVDENALGLLFRVVAPVPQNDWLQLGYRYSYLQPSDRVVADIVQEHSFGLTAALDRINARVFLQGTLVQEEDANQLNNHRLEALIEVRL